MFHLPPMAWGQPCGARVTDTPGHWLPGLRTNSELGTAHSRALRMSLTIVGGQRQNLLPVPSGWVLRAQDSPPCKRKWWVVPEWRNLQARKTPQRWYVRKRLRRRFEKDMRVLLLLYTVSHPSCSLALPGCFIKEQLTHISQAEDTGEEGIYDIMDKQRSP